MDVVKAWKDVDYRRSVGSIGHPSGSVDLAVLDDSTLAEVAVGMAAVSDAFTYWPKCTGGTMTSPATCG